MTQPGANQFSEGKLKRDTELAVAVIAAVAVTIVYSGFNRPIWIDEYLHFAMAGVTWLDAVNLMVETNSNVNHGQTWFHQILSISTLHIFGAGAVGLRVVSWIATLVTILSAFFFLRMFAVSPTVKFLSLSILIAIPTFSFEIGNSRFYMLLIMATSLAALGLFSTIANQCPSYSNRIMLAFGVLIGALSHPYFPVVLIGLLVALYLARHMVLGDSLRKSISVTQYELVITALGTAVSVAVGFHTWMRGGPEFTSMDPFEWLPINLPVFIAVTVLLFICGLASLIWSYRSSRNSQIDIQLAVGVVLLAAGVGMSVLFSWISLARSYWILPRQWLPGSLIALLGLTLVISYFWANRHKQNPKGIHSRVMAVAASAFFGFGVLGGLMEIQTNAQYWDDLRSSELRNLTDDTNQFYTLAGNLNMQCGGRVWSEHSRIYNPENEPAELVTVFSELFEFCTNGNDNH